MLAGRRIVLGVTGGIAAYKAIEVCRRLVDAGAHVLPVMTRGAERFVGATTFSALAAGLSLSIFMYWGWDAALSANEETTGSERTPGIAALLSLLILGSLYVLVGVAALMFAGTGETGVGLGNPDTADNVFATLADPVLGGTLSLLLFLAANTSFAAFPRLAAVLAEDGFIPRQFAFRGDRLAYSTGIVMLGGIAALVVVAGRGSTHALIPLYAVGVFIDFTISQTGMVRHWLRTRDPGWRYRLAINATGAVLTGVIAIVVTSVKFVDDHAARRGRRSL